MDFGVEISKILVWIWNQHTWDALCTNFTKNGQLRSFGPKYAQKWTLGSGFQKSKSGCGISTFKIPCVPIFSQSGQLLIFRPKFGGPFTCNILIQILLRVLQRAGWRLKWAGCRWMVLIGARWRWMELGGGGCTV